MSKSVDAKGSAVLGNLMLGLIPNTLPHQLGSRIKFVLEIARTQKDKKLYRQTALAVARTGDIDMFEGIARSPALRDLKLNAERRVLISILFNTRLIDAEWIWLKRHQHLISTREMRSWIARVLEHDNDGINKARKLAFEFPQHPSGEYLVRLVTKRKTFQIFEFALRTKKKRLIRRAIADYIAVHGLSDDFITSVTNAGYAIPAAALDALLRKPKNLNGAGVLKLIAKRYDAGTIERAIRRLLRGKEYFWAAHWIDATGFSASAEMRRKILGGLNEIPLAAKIAEPLQDQTLNEWILTRALASDCVSDLRSVRQTLGIEPSVDQWMTYFEVAISKDGRSATERYCEAAIILDRHELLERCYQRAQEQHLDYELLRVAVALRNPARVRTALETYLRTHHDTLPEMNPDVRELVLQAAAIVAETPKRQRQKRRRS